MRLSASANHFHLMVQQAGWVAKITGLLPPTTCIQSCPQIRRPHDAWIVIVIVDGAVITQLVLLVEHKYFWRALSTVGLCHLLAFIEQIWEIEVVSCDVPS